MDIVTGLQLQKPRTWLLLVTVLLTVAAGFKIAKGGANTKVMMHFGGWDVEGEMGTDLFCSTYPNSNIKQPSLPISSGPPQSPELRAPTHRPAKPPDSTQSAPVPIRQPHPTLTRLARGLSQSARHG